MSKLLKFVDATDRVAGHAQPDAASKVNITPPFKGFVMVDPALRTPPTSTADRLSFSLAALLDHGPAGLAFLQRSPIRFLPERLAFSGPVVVSMTTLFCSVWEDHCRQRAPSQKTLLRCVRAVQEMQQTLRRALAGRASHAEKHELLIGATLFQRMQPLLCMEASPNWRTHFEALRHLMIDMGPPGMEHEFETAMTQANIASLVRARPGGGPSTDFLTQSPWKEFVDEFGTEYWRFDELDAFDSDSCTWIEYNAHRIHGWVNSLIHIRTQDRDSPEMRQLADVTRAELCEFAQMGRVAIRLTTQRLIDSGALEVITDHDAHPSSYLRTRYHFSQPSVAGVFSTMLSPTIAVLRMLYELSTIYGEETAQGYYDEYLGFCAHVWRLIPYMRSLEPVTGLAIGETVHMTFEAAEGELKEQILDLVAYVDGYMGRYGGDRDVMAMAMLHKGKALTGRIETDFFLAFVLA